MVGLFSKLLPFVLTIGVSAWPRAYNNPPPSYGNPPPPYNPDLRTVTTFGDVASPKTTTVKAHGNQPASVVVELPYKTVTKHIPSVTHATTVTSKSQVIVELPVRTVTTFGPVQRPTTRTVKPSGTHAASVIVELPYITTTKTVPGLSKATTITSKSEVIVENPGSSVNANIKTLTRFGAIARPTTITIPATNGHKETIMISRPYITTTKTIAGLAQPTTVTSVSQIIIERPGKNLRTITSFNSNVDSATTTTVPASGTHPASVVVYMPYVTRFTAVDGLPKPKTTTSGSYLIIEEPASYITSMTFDPTLTQAITTTIATASGTRAGTVLLERPYKRTTTYIAALTEPTTITEAPSKGLFGEPGTLLVELPYVTTTSFIATLASPTTITQDPTSTEAGTVLVELPYVASTTYIATLASPTTITEVPASSGQPGTVLVESPYVSVTTYIATLASPTTITQDPTSSGAPGTILVERPYVTSTTYIGTLASETTITQDPTSSGAPGTILVEEPYVTTTTYIATLASVTTVTQDPTSSGAPGTILVEEPYVTTTTYIATLASATTITQDPTSSGAPGTILVEDPYVTTTTYIATLANPTTITESPTGTKPGTIVVESPYVTTTSYIATLANPTTITENPTSTEPGTIVVESPYVTTTSYIATLANPTTITENPTSTEPGTILVESPYVTTTSFIANLPSETTITEDPVGTTPGSIVIEQAQYTTVSSVDTAFPQTTTRTVVVYSSNVASAGTVEVDIPGYTTVTTHSDIPQSSTSTSVTYTAGRTPAPGVGVQGTIVQILPEYTTTTVYGTQFASTATTTVVPYTGGAALGTVEVDAPATYTTLTAYYSDLQSTTTSTLSTYTGGAPGTLIVEEPQQTANPVNPGPQTTGTAASTSGLTFPTAVSTTDPAATETADCGNRGLAFAVQSNIAGRDPPGSGYPTFIAEDYKAQSVIYNGITNTMGGIDLPPTDTPFTLYGQYNSPTSQSIVINHQAYLYAPVSGLYTFQTYDSDDIVLMWLGQNAYSGWVRNLNSAVSNTALDTTYEGGQPISFQVELNAGDYYPFRVMYANAFYDAVFEAYIFAPDGTELLGPDTNQDSPYIVQFSCPDAFGGSQAAPPFPAFPGT